MKKLNLGSSKPKVFYPPICGTLIKHDGCTYQIGKKLGQGYFGAVYECIDSWGNELVAKVMMPHQTYEEVAENWLEELKKTNDVSAS